MRLTQVIETVGVSLIHLVNRVRELLLSSGLLANFSWYMSIGIGSYATPRFVVTRHWLRNLLMLLSNIEYVATFETLLHGQDLLLVFASLMHVTSAGPLNTIIHIRQVNTTTQGSELLLLQSLITRIVHFVDKAVHLLSSCNRIITRLGGALIDKHMRANRVPKDSCINSSVD